MEDFDQYIGKEAIWHGRWVIIEDADRHGVEVTDQDGGNHSLSWGSIDVL